MQRLKKIGKPAGILTPNEDEAKHSSSGATPSWRSAPISACWRAARMRWRSESRVVDCKSSARGYGAIARLKVADALAKPSRAWFLFSARRAVRRVRGAMAGARGARLYPAAAARRPRRPRLGRRVGSSSHPSAAGRLAVGAARRRNSHAGFSRRASAAIAARRRADAARGADLLAATSLRAISVVKLDAPSAYDMARPTRSRPVPRYSLDELREAFAGHAAGTPTPMRC